VVGLAIPYTKFFSGKHNAYIVFQNSFAHLINEQNLYVPYPGEYNSLFRYGPVFCVLMAPFAVLPEIVGSGLYLLVSAGLLFLAIQSLPVEKMWRNGFCLICLFDFANNQNHFQTNAFIAALIILSFTCVLRDKNILAAACVALGLFTKLYGIAGIVFLVFSRQKIKFLVSFLCWSVAFYFLPVVFGSLEFVNESYRDWLSMLLDKNRMYAELGGFQDQSVLGLVRRLAQTPDIPQLPILLLGFGLLFGPYLRFSNYGNRRFRFLSLACVLMFVVLFSSASENPTYVILQCGVAAWFCVGSNLGIRFKTGLLVAVLIFSSFAPTDLFPGMIRDFFNRYSLRVVPCMAVWLTGLYEMFKCNGASISGPEGKPVPAEKPAKKLVLLEL